MRTNDQMSATESFSSAAPANSRRALLARVARLSVMAAPVTLALLGPATASAQERQRDRRDYWPDPRSTAGFAPVPADRGPNTDLRRGTGVLGLVTVGSVNGGTGGGDFGANNPGGDGLSSGSVAIDAATRQVSVDLRGAVSNVSYDLQFVRMNDHGREDLGSINTDGNGNGSGTTSNALGGNQRVGAIVVIRNGQDQYVTVFP